MHNRATQAFYGRTGKHPFIVADADSESVWIEASDDNCRTTIWPTRKQAEQIVKRLQEWMKASDELKKNPPPPPCLTRTPKQHKRSRG